MFCPNHGIISFTLEKLTLRGGHQLNVAPKFCLFEVQTCSLNRSRGQPSSFCREPWCSPNCSRASIKASSGQHRLLVASIAGMRWSRPTSYEGKGPQTAISMPMTDSNHGINDFPVGKLILPCGHGLTLVPNMGACVVKMPHWAATTANSVHPSCHPSIYPSIHPTNHTFIHPCIHVYTRICIGICIQRRLSQYVMGGGWELYKQ